VWAQFLAVEIKRLLDGFGGNQHQQRLVRVELDVGGIFRKRQVVFEHSRVVLHAGRVALRGRNRDENAESERTLLERDETLVCIRGYGGVRRDVFLPSIGRERLVDSIGGLRDGVGRRKDCARRAREYLLGAGDPRKLAGVERAVGLRFGFRTSRRASKRR
jgi:hypothetical protein